MGKAFVAKLAKQGARDPEALAAWIGRKKHGAAFKKLASAGRKNAKASKKPATARKSSEGKAPAKKAAPAPRDMQRGFRSADTQRPVSERRFAVSDQELNSLRGDVAYDRTVIARQEARGDTHAAALTRHAMEERQTQIADAEHARETRAGDQAYEQSAEKSRAAAREAVAKARRTDSAEDWDAAAAASESFAGQAGASPYGARDTGWYRSEAEGARKSAVQARERATREAAEKQARTLPAPAAGEVPVAHSVVLGSDGVQSFGDPNRARSAQERDRASTVMSDTGAQGHDSALQNVSPAFRRKVQEARASGQPWLHQVSQDSAGAEIHSLQVMGPDGKFQKTQYLERNSKKWKEQEAQRRASR